MRGSALAGVDGMPACLPHPMQVDAERMDSQRKFYSELQSFESDMRSGGQSGMNPHLKKKK